LIFEKKYYIITVTDNFGKIFGGDFYNEKENL
jgi:hypothetical protein